MPLALRTKATSSGSGSSRRTRSAAKLPAQSAAVRWRIGTAVFLRGPDGVGRLRIDCKTVHVESAEYAARFGTPVASKSADADVLI